ncbi:metallophosphoesterase [Thermoactinomyces sp. DSM 45892]|uniref:metallophosphoesterase n=1 Tax=Thermoactinomyces sp. DSM 45892 TaxID=1882753 RepID=UPI00089A6006|nr:metallophosphoesterase [Thermoactinomyces sp. DSM 45892]SDY53263.1 hypothetical protein SAMN05444416_105176 [Thermoactinomyces sp. DSM 45892]
MKANRKISRRSFLKKSMYYSLGTIGALGVSGAYSRWIEPYSIETTTITIKIPHLPVVFEGFRICHFSDLHLGFHLEAKDLETVVEQIQSLKPDCICFTGDLFDHHSTGVSETTRYLSKLEASYGKYAVLGNHDNWGNRESVNRVLTKSGFTILHNENRQIKKQSDSIYMVGVDDPWVGGADILRALNGVPKNTCNILLAHEPDFADEFCQHPIDLQLSGHSHGGQVQVPFIGALHTPPHAKKYIDGLYQVENSSMQVYTTRGIGMTRMPIRFNCRPELVLITLKPSK